MLAYARESVSVLSVPPGSAGVSPASIRPVANLLWLEPVEGRLPTGLPTKLTQLRMPEFSLFQNRGML